jgi:hypothetical protein
MGSIEDWMEREIGVRFPDGEILTAGQLRVRVAKLCFELLDRERTNDSGLPTRLDHHRLVKAAKALTLGEPATKKEAEAQLKEIHDAICALQSTDDLGSPEANEKVANDCIRLQTKYDRLKERLGEGGES